jgi:hypothetical protein
MKKVIFTALIATGIIFNACNPMQDIMDELDKNYAAEDSKAAFLKDKKIAPEAYTLSDEDYELSSNDAVSNYKNFSNDALPKDYLPEILNQKFSGENAQSMTVTYNFYSKPVVDYAGARSIKDDEYQQMGQNYPNFSDEAEAKSLIAKLLDREVHATDEGTEMTVKYVKFQTNTTRYVKVNADFSTEVLTTGSGAIVVTDAQYEAMGKGRYKNFDDIDQAQSLLAELAETEGTAPITYSCAVYRNYLDMYVVYFYNGTNWEVKQSVMPRSEELNYALNNDDITQSYWWADPAIKITLSSIDYALYPGDGSAGGTARYGNFDLRSGNIPGPDTAKLVEMIGGMLDANYSAVENQQYLVTYAYYDGSSGSKTIRIIKTSGIWQEVSE